MNWLQGHLGLDLLVVLAWGLALSLLFWALRSLIDLLPLGQDRRVAARRSMPVIGFVVSIVFALFSVSTLFGRYPEVLPYAYLVVVILFGAVAWRVLGDVLAGVALRAEGTCQLGDHVAVGDVQGRVVDLGLRTLIVESQGGDRVVVPYGQATQQALVRAGAQRVGAAAHFELVVPAGSRYADVAERIRHAALLCHWSSIARPATVRRVAPDRIEVSVFSLHADHLSDIETAVRTAIRTDVSES